MPTVEGFAADLNSEERNEVLNARVKDGSLAKIQEFFAKQKLAEIQVDLSKSGPSIISGILKAARERKIGGPCRATSCWSKIGASVQESAAHITVDNFNTTAADKHLDRDGDFRIGDTAFHVTVAPTSLHIEKCGENINKGLRQN